MKEFPFSHEAKPQHLYSGYSMSESKHIYIVYKTTNLVNNFIYIGVHRQDFHFPVIFDDYLGSGKHLIRAIKKYGKENFIRETLHVFYTPEEAYSKEKELVNEAFILRKDVYNLKLGGNGGSTIFMKNETKTKISNSLKGRSGGMLGKNNSPETKKRMSSSHSGEKNAMYGKPKTKEVKQKISQSLQGRKQPEEIVRKRAESLKGKVSPLRGRNIPDETKEKMRTSHLGKTQPIIKCPHCNKNGGASNMKRWHFDNCKFKISASFSSVHIV